MKAWKRDSLIAVAACLVIIPVEYLLSDPVAIVIMSVLMVLSMIFATKGFFGAAREIYWPANDSTQSELDDLKKRLAVADAAVDVLSALSDKWQEKYEASEKDRVEDMQVNAGTNSMFAQSIKELMKENKKLQANMCDHCG